MTLNVITLKTSIYNPKTQQTHEHIVQFFLFIKRTTTKFPQIHYCFRKNVQRKQCFMLICIAYFHFMLRATQPNQFLFGGSRSG